jgi:alpha-L-fucosidase
VNGEAIYGTRASPFTKLSFYGRATQKGNKLYLHVFQWPKDGKLRVAGLKNVVISSRLLADPSTKLGMDRDGEDVILKLPAAAPDEIASVIELTLDGAPVAAPSSIRANEDGSISLGVESSEIETRFEQRAKTENALGHVFVTRWTRPDDVPTWKVAVPKAGRYDVEILYAATRGSAGVPFTVNAGGTEAAGKVVDTGGEWVFKRFPVGTLMLKEGEQVIQVKSKAQPGIAAMNLEGLNLKPAK